MNTILATSAVIITAVNVYRFDFPSIDTYTGSFASTDSLTLIADDTHSTKQVVNETSSPIEITGNVVLSGNFTLDGENVGTTLADIIARLVALEST